MRALTLLFYAAMVFLVGQVANLARSTDVYSPYQTLIEWIGLGGPVVFLIAAFVVWQRERKGA